MPRFHGGTPPGLEDRGFRATGCCFAGSGAELEGNPAPLHSAARSVQYSHGMAHMMATLRDGLDRVGVEFWDTHRVLDLHFSVSGNVAGATIYDGSSGVLCGCEVAAIVLATGGCGQLFPVTSNGPDATGDGSAEEDGTSDDGSPAGHAADAPAHAEVHDSGSSTDGATSPIDASPEGNEEKIG